MEDLKILINKIIDKLLYNFISSYGYTLSFEVGEPHLVVQEYNKNHSIYKRLKKYDLNQKNFKTNIVGDLTFFTESYWTLNNKNKEICNANEDHIEIVNILNFVLTGHFIESIIYNDQGNIVMKFSNQVFLEIHSFENDIPEISFLVRKSSTFILKDKKVKIET